MTPKERAKKILKSVIPQVSDEGIAFHEKLKFIESQIEEACAKAEVEAAARCSNKYHPQIRAEGFKAAQEKAAGK